MATSVYVHYHCILQGCFVVTSLSGSLGQNHKAISKAIILQYWYFHSLCYFVIPPFTRQPLSSKAGPQCRAFTTHHREPWTALNAFQNLGELSHSSRSQGDDWWLIYYLQKCLSQLIHSARDVQYTQISQLCSCTIWTQTLLAKIIKYCAFYKKALPR